MEEANLRQSSSTTAASLYDPYIRIPSDLFGLRQNRHAPAIVLPMPTIPSDGKRTAGVYPPARPLPSTQPWTLQSHHGGVLWQRGDVGHSILLEQRYIHRRRGGLVGLLNPCRGDGGGGGGLSAMAKWQEGGRVCGSRVYRPAGVWERQRSLVHHLSLSYPEVKRKELQKRMQADEVLDEDIMAGACGGDDDELEDFIDMVARANNVQMEPANMLPVVRASPCAMHSRNNAPLDRRGLDPFYATNCHAGKVKGMRLSPQLPEKDNRGFKGYSHSDYTPRSLRERALLKDLAEPVGIGGIGGGGGEKGQGGRDTNNNRRGFKGGMLGDLQSISPRGRQPFPNQSRVMPAKLPGELPPKDVVISWLKHGSAPLGESHFPDITQSSDRSTVERPQNQSAVSE